MTPKEFKAWFEGFTEAFTGCPTKAQWARIKERVAEIDGKETTQRIFVDRYWPMYYPVYTTPYFTPYFTAINQPYYTGFGSASGIQGGGSGWTQNTSMSGAASGGGGGTNWSSTNAMRSLGQVDAQALKVVS
jgi:hypothetical protein